MLLTGMVAEARERACAVRRCVRACDGWVVTGPRSARETDGARSKYNSLGIHFSETTLSQRTIQSRCARQRRGRV